MMSSSVPYTVPKQPGTWPAIFLALLVHAVLFAFLWVGINWVNNTPETIEAEVWSTKELQQAPPPPVQPPPQPQPEVIKPQPQVEDKPEVEKPDIALEQEKKRKEKEKEKEKLAQQEEEKKKEAAAQKKKDDEEKQKLADEKHKQEVLDAKKLKQQREEELKRITGETSTADSSGTAAKSSGNKSNATWVAKVTAKVKSNIVGVTVPPSYEGNDPVEYVVGLLPDGSVAGIRKTKSSGLPGFDDAVKRAIEASQPYPADSSGRVPPSFISTNRPKDQ